MPAHNHIPVAIRPTSHLEKFSNKILTMAESAFSHKLIIRGNAKSSAFVRSLKKAGLSLPAKPHLAVGASPRTLFQLGFDEWLVRFDEEDDFQTAFEKLTSGLKYQHIALVEVSDYYAVLRLESNILPILLQKNSSFNFSAENFNKGDAISTRFAHCTTHIHGVEKNIFDLQTRWTHIPFVWDVLANSAKNAEFNPIT